MNTHPDGISTALDMAYRFGQTDGDHHKAWVIDQMVRNLLSCPVVTKEAVDCNGKAYSYTTLGESPEYEAWVRDYEAVDTNGEKQYVWDTGITP